MPLSGVHDVSDGGLAVCLAEICCAAGTGATLEGGAVESVAALFSEAPSRVVVCTPEPSAVIGRCTEAGVEAVTIGRAGGDRLIIPGLVDLEMSELSDARTRKLPEAVTAGRR